MSIKTYESKTKQLVTLLNFSKVTLILYIILCFQFLNEKKQYEVKQSIRILSKMILLLFRILGC